MNYTIDQFMWGYQQHFSISLNTFAESVFNKLDSGGSTRLDIRIREVCSFEP